MRGRVRATVAAVLLALPACGVGDVADIAVPRCRAGERLATVAQSVPSASYLPCLRELPAGWTVVSFSVTDVRTRLSLRSDRERHPVDVTLRRSCDVRGATPVAPRDEGVRTLQRVTSIAPRYAGTIYDLFPGGCVTYEFDFVRGPHIVLADEMLAAIDLYPRRQLRDELEHDFDITLDP
jgi:hypothetical protein